MPITRTSGQGRPKGVPNKHPSALKEMILGALSDVGGRDWLAKQANKNPVAFMALIGKVLPLQLANEDDTRPLRVIFKWADAAPTIEHESSEQQPE